MNRFIFFILFLMLLLGCGQSGEKGSSELSSSEVLHSTSFDHFRIEKISYEKETDNPSGIQNVAHFVLYFTEALSESSFATAINSETCFFEFSNGFISDFISSLGLSAPYEVARYSIWVYDSKEPKMIQGRIPFVINGDKQELPDDIEIKFNFEALKLLKDSEGHSLFFSDRIEDLFMSLHKENHR